MFFKLAGGATIAPGIYTGIVPIQWSWNFCNGIAAPGLCVGFTDTGVSTVQINITLSVDARPPTVSLSFNPTSWDPVTGRFFRKPCRGASAGWQSNGALNHGDILSAPSRVITGSTLSHGHWHGGRAWPLSKSDTHLASVSGPMPP